MADPLADMEDPASYLDRFVVQRTLGEGSYGKVKLALDTKYNRPVALKIIAKTKQTKLSRVKREIRILRLLHHPHIVKLYDVVVSLSNASAAYKAGER
jgi:serine/threonine protein kinase